MELSRQMLLLTAENYGSYYLHITKYKNYRKQDFSPSKYNVIAGLSLVAISVTMFLVATCHQKQNCQYNKNVLQG